MRRNEYLMTADSFTNERVRMTLVEASQNVMIVFFWEYYFSFS